MSAQSFEILLARLYTDPNFRKSFLADAEKTLTDCDLTAEEKADLKAIDRAGLVMASHSFFHKRKKRLRPSGWPAFILKMKGRRIFVSYTRRKEKSTERP